MFSLEFSAWKPLWTLLIALAAIPALYFSWRSTYSVAGSGRTRFTLFLLRVAAIFVIIFMSTQAVLLISRAEKLPPKLLILADASPSILAEGALPAFEKSLKDEIELIKKSASDATISLGLFSADTVIDSFAGMAVQILSKSDGSTRIDGLLERERADAVIMFTDGRIQDKLRWRFRQKLPLFNQGLL
ncbi:MAG: hypothetical protein JNL74_18320, partial [Fibrobacteres bacterium]|nr:hypothetical protein [Fibrobacterota bacterium]